MDDNSGRNGRWQMVSRMLPSADRTEMISHAVLTEGNRLTILCLHQHRAGDPPNAEATSLQGARVTLEEIVLRMSDSIEEEGGDDLASTITSGAAAERIKLGQVSDADVLLCPLPSATGKEEDSRGTHFWVVSTRRSLAFLWSLDKKRCLRRIKMPSFDSLHLCAHNPSGDLLWIGPNGAVSICKCEETGGADEDDQTLLSFLRPSLPEDEEVAAVVSVGPFLWILTEEFQKKTHLSHRGVTIFAYHAVSGVCVGKKRTNLFGDTSASQPSGGPKSAQCTLLPQANTMSCLLVSVGGDNGGVMCKCHLKVPAAMSIVLSTVLERLDAAHSTPLAGAHQGLGLAGFDKRKPSVRQDLDLVTSLLRHELSQWGDALQQHRAEAEVARAEIMARVCGLGEAEEIWGQTSAMAALLVQSRTRERELVRVLELLVRKETEKREGRTLRLPDPQDAIDENTRKILEQFLAEIRSKDSESQGGPGGSFQGESSLLVMGAGAGAKTYHQGDRIRLCLYFFQEILATVLLSPSSSEVEEDPKLIRGVRALGEAFGWFAAHLGEGEALSLLAKRVSEEMVCEYAEALAILWGTRGVPGEDCDRDLHWKIAFEITCLMLYLVLPHHLVSFVLSYGQAKAKTLPAEGREGSRFVVRGHAFRASSVLPALHIQGPYETPPRDIVATQVQTQARLMVCGGHPLCALHILWCRGARERDPLRAVIDLLEWTRNLADPAVVEAAVPTLVEHVVMKMLGGSHGEGTAKLRAEAGLLLRTLAKPRKSDQDSDLSVIEAIVQEAIAALIVSSSL